MSLEIYGIGGNSSAFDVALQYRARSSMATRNGVQHRETVSNSRQILLANTDFSQLFYGCKRDL